MDYLTLIYKILYRLYLSSGLPLAAERITFHKRHGLPRFCSLNITCLKEQLTAHVKKKDFDHLRERVHSIMNGWYHIFHEPPIKCTVGVFQRHPRTGKTYGLPHFSRVHIKSGSGDEDVKFIWELNRLSALDSLLASALIEDQREYLCKASHIVSQWRRENPFHYGISWYSNMEAALRLLRFILLKGLLSAYECDTSDVDAALMEHYYSVSFRWRFTKKTMMAGNHLIVELASLAVYEIMTGAQGKAYHMFCKEAQRQFFLDGGYIEGSTGYHVYVLSVLLFAQWLAQGLGLRTDILDSVIRRAVRFLEIISGPDGTIPAIGDWDDGALFRPFSDNPRNVLDLINFYYAKKTDIKLPLSTKNWTFLPSSGMAVHQRKDGTVISFHSSSVHYGHSHLDMLSLNVMTSEGPLILDGGTYAYNYDPEIRLYYRGHEAHSTLFSPDFLPLKPQRRFAWKGSLLCHLNSSGSEVTGHYELKDRGIVRRTVTLQDDGCIITDLCPQGDSWWCQFIVPKAEISDSGVIVKNAHNRPVLLLSACGQNVRTLIKPHNISYYYGKEEKAAAVCFSVYRKSITKLKFL
jgi:hypothetical protein